MRLWVSVWAGASPTSRQRSGTPGTPGIWEGVAPASPTSRRGSGAPGIRRPSRASEMCGPKYAASGQSPRQPDYFNCGIFPILLARCLHHGVQITRGWSQEDLDEQRDLITLELLEGKVLSFRA